MNKKYDDRHGGPYDRGSADSYYDRPRNPHYWTKGSYDGEEITKSEMTSDEVEAYNAGYDDNEQSGNKKNWH